MPSNNKNLHLGEVTNIDYTTVGGATTPFGLQRLLTRLIVLLVLVFCLFCAPTGV